MHAVKFWGQGRGLLVGQSVLPVIEKKEGRGEKKYRPYDEIWTREP